MVRAGIEATLAGITDVFLLFSVAVMVTGSIVRHGEFLTVYSNLDEVLVSKGQKITTKQRIGRVYTDRNENKTELHFEIWQAKELMNPAYWLAGK